MRAAGWVGRRQKRGGGRGTAPAVRAEPWPQAGNRQTTQTRKHTNTHTQKRGDRGETENKGKNKRKTLVQPKFTSGTHELTAVEVMEGWGGLEGGLAGDDNTGRAERTSTHCIHKQARHIHGTLHKRAHIQRSSRSFAGFLFFSFSRSRFGK